MNNPYDVYRPKGEQKKSSQSVVKTGRKIASEVIPPLINPLFNFPETKLPRVSLPEQNNPILRFLFKDIAEDIINQPASSAESLGKINKSFKQAIAGEKTRIETPQQLIGEAANTALLPLTFVGGGAASSIAKSAGKAAFKTALKKGVITGMKTGAGFGGAQGLANAQESSLKDQLIEGAKGVVAGGTLGGITGGIVPGGVKLKKSVLPVKSTQTSQKSGKVLLKNALDEGQNVADDAIQPLGTKNSVQPIVAENSSTPLTVAERIQQDTEKRLNAGFPKDKRVFLIDWRSPENVFKKLGVHESVYMPLKKGQEQTAKEVELGYGKMNTWYSQLGGKKETTERVFDFLDGQPVSLTPTETKVAQEIKGYLKEWADKIGLPEERRIRDYITHVFDPDLKDNQIPDELANILEYTSQKGFFNPYLEARTGKLGYKKDLFGALDAYINRSAKKLYLDEPVKKAIAVSETLEPHARNYVSRVIEGLKNKPDWFEKAVQANIVDALPESARTKLGYRPVKRAVQGITGQIYRGALGLNLNSALKNLTQGVNTFSEIGPSYTLRGYKQLLEKGTKELVDKGVIDDMLLADYRRGPVKNIVQKMDNVLFYMFEGAEKINRGSAYFGAKEKALAQGMPVEQAIAYAKNIVRKTQFAYGKLDSPLALQNSLGKMLLQFSTFPIKQAELVGGWAKNKEYAKLMRYIGSSLALTYSIGDLLGIEPKDMLFKNIVPGLGPLPELATAGVKAGLAKVNNRNISYEDEFTLQNAPKVFLPAGVQADKTLQGVQAVRDEGVFTKTGKKKYGVETPQDKLTSLLFGPWRSSEAIAQRNSNEPFSLADLYDMINQGGQPAQAQNNPYSQYRPK